ncbi:hypothetical protein NIES2101_00320 [Calothrix sp. HK-06]|nr:hypothetical protein NIES2101_00320 [Calothrix sp. HK-06]
MTIFCTDIGNYSSITALAGQKPQIIRSAICDVTYTSARTEPTADSPSVEIDGKKLILGNRAIKQKQQATAAERGKSATEIVKPFLFAGLTADFDGTVRFLVPERHDWDEDSIRKALIAANPHEVVVNGKVYKHRVKAVDFYLETDIAVSHAYAQGKLDADGDTLAIDIGGGTTNFVVMTPDGDVLARRSIPKVGGVSLANDVINSDLMQQYAKRESAVFNTSKLMDAIADGSLSYGRRYDFSSVFPGLLENWFNNLIDSIQTSVNAYMADVTNVMIIGGNANLVRDKLGSKPGFYIPENPQLSNIEALMAI